jgi:Gpi18-like mannosyltransferase
MMRDDQETERLPATPSLAIGGKTALPPQDDIGDLDTLIRPRVQIASDVAEQPTRPLPVRLRDALPRQVVILLLVALLIRLPIAPFRGFFADVWYYMFWGFAFIHSSFHNYYHASDANYPPLTPYLFAIVARIYYTLANHWPAAFPPVHYFVFLPDPTHNSPYSSLTFFAKIPIMIGDLVAIWAIYDIAQRVRSARWALLAAGLYAFSPVVLYDGVLWGQTDGLGMTFIILAVRYLLLKKDVMVGVMLGLALMLKPQPLIFIPLILFYILRWHGWRPAWQATAAFGAVVIILCAPFLIPPHPGILSLFANEGYTIAGVHTTSSAFNMWYIVAPLHRYDTPILGPFTPNLIGYAIFGVFFLVALIGVFFDRSFAMLLQGASIVAVAFFDFTTLQHERYMFPVVVTLLLATIFQSAQKWPYLAANLLVLLNIVIISIRSYVGIGMDALHTLYGNIMAHPFITLACAYMNILLLLFMVFQFGRQLLASGKPQQLLAMLRSEGLTGVQKSLGVRPQ